MRLIRHLGGAIPMSLFLSYRWSRLLRSLAYVVWHLLVTHAIHAGEAGYYRKPAIHENVIVFVGEGDLWTVAFEGGQATRLTTHPGLESYPAVSPDGKLIAFTGQYEGPTEVYVMPVKGGRPRRVTFDGARISHVGWKGDGKVLVGTSADADLPSQQLVVLDVSAADGTITRSRIPLAQAADGQFASNGKLLFFTRLAFQGSHTKNYQGGTAQQLWSFVDGDDEAKPLTSNYPGTSKSPMVWEGRVYFASDRDRTMNLWSIRFDGSDPTQHTRHQGFDLASPALSLGRVVYQLGADLRVFDVAAKTDKLVPITLDSDFDHTREKWIKKPFEFLTDAHLSTDGSKVAVTARGRVFVIPHKEGRLIEAARKPGVRYRDARFIKGTEKLLVQSDESGEVELWSVPANGLGDPVKLTDEGNVLRRQGIPSPDGTFVVHTDKNLRMFLLNLTTKENRLLAESAIDEFADMAWSPDSKWIVFTETNGNLFRTVKLYSTATGKITPVTTERYDNFSPIFSPDGKWLYFLSDRNLKSIVKSPWGTYQPEPYFDKKTRIYQIPLTPGIRSPFARPTELDTVEKSEKKEESREEKPGEKKELAPIEVAIDLNDIAGRLIPVPVPPGNYKSLAVTDKSLFWLSFPAPSEVKATVEGIAIGYEDRDVKTVAENVNAYELSADRKKLLFRRETELHIADAVLEKPDIKKSQIDLSNWTFSVNPREEWRQMFVDAWRLERDYFYDRGMHGLEWPAVRKKYEPLLPRVTDRDELDDLTAQMVSELSALHTNIIAGDVRKGPDDITPGRLGAAFVRDAKAGGFRIERIYRHDFDEPERASPLARPGVDLKAGDTIVAVDGSPVLAAAELGELLRGKAERQVLLEVLVPTGVSRKVVVKPLTPLAEDDLRYHEWEYTRRLTTDELSGGEIGYVHLRAMGGDDFEAWARQYYPAFSKGGLIIDVRHNRGGNIDSWIVGRLLRKAWFYWNQRVGRENRWNMQYAFRGHLAVLCNERTASDGEAFSEAIKRLKLGTVIGTRTWGGEIWLTRSNVLIDKGIASAAEFGVFDQNGVWLIEGHGVEPDIVVDNLPHATFKGEDAQLVAAIKFLKKKLSDEPVKLPPVPPFPKK